MKQIVLGLIFVLWGAYALAQPIIIPSPNIIIPSSKKSLNKDSVKTYALPDRNAAGPTNLKSTEDISKKYINKNQIGRNFNHVE